MKFKNIGNNQNELTINDTRILVSYDTPVAAFIDGEYYRTEKKWSPTTSKHINSWVCGETIERPQDFFDTLVKHVDIQS